VIVCDSMDDVIVRALVQKAWSAPKIFFI
jgi:hypothetical protein